MAISHQDSLENTSVQRLGAQSVDISERASEDFDLSEEIDATTLENKELPLIVWIRGDEWFAEQFNTSADEAMNILGIKRSRLNQISGKELRVGRMRIDRYIRPVYRRVDVESYLAWARSAMSQKKTLDSLQSITEDFHSTLHAITSKIQNISISLSSELNHALQEGFKKDLNHKDNDKKRFLNEKIQNLKDNLRTLIRDESESFNFRLMSLQRLLEKYLAQTKSIENYLSQLSQVFSIFVEVRQQSLTTNEQIKTLFQILENSQSEMRALFLENQKIVLQEVIKVDHKTRIEIQNLREDNSVQMKTLYELIRQKPSVLILRKKYHKKKKFVNRPNHI